jgi:hypothetical protein
MVVQLQSRVAFVDGQVEWLPQQKEVEGKCFVLLNKWTPGFVKLMTNKSLDLRRHKSANSGSVDGPFFARMTEERQKVADALLEEALRMDDGDDLDEEAPPAKRRRRRPAPVRAQQKHKHLLPAILKVPVEDREMLMLFEGVGIGSTQFWVEALPENFQYMKDRIQAEAPKDRKERKKKGTKGDAEKGSDDGQMEEKASDGESASD